MHDRVPKQLSVFLSKAMMQKSQIVDKPHAVLQEIDLIALLSESAGGDDAMLIETRESIVRVFRKFMASQDLSDDRVSVIDGFLFVFNEYFGTELPVLPNRHYYFKESVYLFQTEDVTPTVDTCTVK